METVVAETTAGDASQIGRLDRSAECARISESSVVDQDEQHVRSTSRWHRMADEVPVGL